MVKEKLHYSFYAIPKGRDGVEEFYVSKQTMQIIQTVSRMLKDHYGARFQVLNIVMIESTYFQNSSLIIFNIITKPLKFMQCMPVFDFYYMV